MSNLLARRLSTDAVAYGAVGSRPLDRLSIQLCLMLMAAFLIRVWQFGNPVIHVDEQFYLLVGDRMLQGALPYVDIWDRKPVGLFLIYAAIRTLGGEGIYQYQIVATLFAGVTAFLIARIALRISSGLGAASAGIVYLCWLMIFGGDGGQSPVFYNAFVAGGALLTLRLVTTPSLSIGRLANSGALIMLLVGLAMQVKYPALFEGIFFGIALMWTAWRVFHRPLVVTSLAALWVTVALVPTALAWAYYASLGHSEIFIFSNFLSIFNRPPSAAGDLISRLSEMVVFSIPLWLCAIAGIWGRFDAGALLPAEGAKTFLVSWLAAAVIGLLIPGTYYGHYYLPVLVPLSVLIAPLAGAPGTGINLFTINRRQITTPFIGVLAIMGLIAAKIQINEDIWHRGDGSQIDRIAKVIEPRLKDCPFVFDFEPILYLMTNSCFNSRFVFPPHLASYWETNAGGVNTLAEVQRILARKPSIIVSTAEIEHTPNPATWRLVQSELERHYRPIYSEKIGDRTRVVYERSGRH